MAVLTRHRRPGLGAGLAVAVLALAASASGATLEYAVKANYLYKFAPFVVWPPSVLPADGGPLNVCVVGEDPFGSALDDAVRGQAVDGHPVVVRRLASITANPGCHVLYIGRTTGQHRAEILQLLRGAPVLTVTDEAAGFGGGIIHFVVRDGKVRFGVDAGAAQASGLTISSKLFGLAVPVAGRSP
jgi:hypothetical protein